MPWSHDYDDYLHDESRRVGEADSISFPTSEAEVIDAIKAARERRESVTVQGARTGIVAGAVPHGGTVLNLSRMKAIGEVNGDRVTVQPGALLSEVREAVARHGMLFPPDPTETSASIGGMVASNASGAMSYHYGATRKWVSALRIVLSDGSIMHIKRGENHAQGRSFSLTTENGRVIAGDLPTYTMPAVKSAAGYYVADDMDVIDLFVGMEGTLGVVTEIELMLLARPKAISGLTLFLPSEEGAIKLVRVLRGEDVEGFEAPATRPIAIEFFNHDVLDLLRKAKSEHAAFAAIPVLRPHFHTAIYVEFHGESDEALEEAVMQAMEAGTALGSNEDDTWYATTDRELEPLKAFRHATPEAVNLLIDERKRTCPDLAKLGTDMSVPDANLGQVLDMYNAGLRDRGLESVIFGHIGNNHVHVNILPHDMGEYETGRSLYLTWAQEIVSMGGSVSAEHGIGKTKTAFLKMMYGEEAIDQMRALKAIFDPETRLNPGNLFEA